MDDRLLRKMGELAKGNPGAMVVCDKLYKEFGEWPLEELDRLGIFGPRIWELFKGICGENLAEMIKTLNEGTALEKLGKG